jgi:tRNA G10  N-methylase Trm11
MVGIARQNLEFFGYPASVEYGDALNCQQKADAIITDLPYGRILKSMADQEMLNIFQHCNQLAPKAIFLVEKDVATLMKAAGYSEVRVYSVMKWHGMKRFVHIGTM